ncbi:MAG: restriction endonuclease subunit S [Nitrospirales bacterium]
MRELVNREWPQRTIKSSSYLKGRIGWQGLRADEFIDHGPYLITGTDFQDGNIDWSTCYHVTEARFQEGAYIHVRNGDLLITKDGTIGKVAYVTNCPEKAVLNSGVFLLRCADGSYNHRFLYHLLRSSLFDEFLRLNLAGSTINHLYQNVFERFSFPIPKPEVQKGITAVLDTVDSQIEQTEALIAKYQQIKAGLMHDLFTRGVTPDGHLRPTYKQAPHLYKESPHGWIPKEWSLEKLGSLAEIVSGVTLGMESETNNDLEVPYLRVANVQDGFFDLAEVKTIRVSRSEFEKLQLRKGDVLMNEGGDFDKLGRGSVWNEEIAPCIHQNHVFRVRPTLSVLRSHYLAFWSQSEFGKKYFVLNSKQSTNLASINSSQLNRFPVAVPSNKEQCAIESRIFSMIERVTSLSDEALKLQLLKQGLMQDLLTGRVCVKVAEPAEGRV